MARRADASRRRQWRVTDASRRRRSVRVEGGAGGASATPGEAPRVADASDCKGWR